MTTKEEKRQLLIEFRKYLCEHTHSTASFIYWPDAERFIKALPDEGEKVDMTLLKQLIEEHEFNTFDEEAAFQLGYIKAKNQTP